MGMRRLSTLSTAALVAVALSACSDDSSVTTPNEGDPTESSESSGPPGGTSGSDVIDEYDRLEDGRVFSGITNVGDDEFDAAVCEFLFGTPEEVAAYAGLSGDVHLVPESGERNSGGGGSGYRCGWGTSDDPDFFLELWSIPADREPTDEELDNANATMVVFSEEDTSGWYVTAAYLTDVPDDAPDESDMLTWLREASARTNLEASGV